MKRTGEITLSIIGAITALFGIIIFSALRKFFLMDEIVGEFVEGFNEEMISEGLDTIDTASFAGGISVFFNFVLIIFITALIVGTIAAFLFKNNNKPKAAGIILIIASVIVTLGTIGIGLITGILLFIAGIMGLVRKPKINDPFEEPDYQNNLSINE